MRNLLPVERELVAGVMSGPRYDANWLSGSDSLDFFDLTGTLTTSLERMGVAALYQSADDPLFHPGRCASIAVAGAQTVDVGKVGELHPDIREAFDLGTGPGYLFRVATG